MKKSPVFSACSVFCLLVATATFSAQNFETFQNENDCSMQGRWSRDKLFEKQMDEYISNQMVENNGAGVSIVVVKNNRVIYEKGFGYADKENNIAVKPSTLFHVGSITKLFTGIGIMQLAQKGLIDIDAPIQQYIPDFSIKYHTYSKRPITIRSIMSHQSGIFGDKATNWDNSANPEDDFRNYPEFVKNEYAAYHPNYITAYSNFAISLLGLIIEQVSHQKYEDYIYDNILKPCGMIKSGFDPKNDHESLLAKGYAPDGSLFPYYTISDNPAGFLASSSNDMAKFITMILNNGYYNRNRILNPFTLKYMYRSQCRHLPMSIHEEYASSNNFGLSWIIENESFDYMGRVIGHGGNLPPYNSNLLIAKYQKIGVFVTSNKADFYPDDISYYALTLAGKLYNNLDKPDLPAIPPVITLPKYYEHLYTGTYCVLGSNPFEVFSNNDTLYLHELHSQPIPLVYHADGWFSLVINNEIMTGVRYTIKHISGQKVLCAESRNTYSINRMIIGNNFVPKELPSDEIDKLTGIYVDVTSGYPALAVYTDMLHHSKESFLTAVRLDYNIPYVLNPSEDHTLIIQGLGRGAQETAYFTNDTLNYSGYKLVKLDAMQPKASRSIAKTSDEQKVKSAMDVFIDLKKQIEKNKTF